MLSKRIFLCFVTHARLLSILLRIASIKFTQKTLSLVNKQKVKHIDMPYASVTIAVECNQVVTNEDPLIEDIKR
jgi:hypothetical protein